MGPKEDLQHVAKMDKQGHITALYAVELKELWSVV
jgi:hypothetical protein